LIFVIEVAPSAFVIAGEHLFVVCLIHTFCDQILGKGFFVGWEPCRN